MGLVVFEQSGIEVMVFQAKHSFGAEAFRIDALRGGLTWANQIQVVRYAAKSHIQSCDLTLVPIDFSGLQIESDFVEVEGFKSHSTG